jgi:hypothetical protein
MKINFLPSVLEIKDTLLQSFERNRLQNNLTDLDQKVYCVFRGIILWKFSRDFRCFRLCHLPRIKELESNIFPQGIATVLFLVARF